MRLKFLEDIKNGMDNKENKNEKLRESLNKKIDYESELLTFLNNITSNYDLLHDNKNEYLINDEIIAKYNKIN